MIQSNNLQHLQHLPDTPRLSTDPVLSPTTLLKYTFDDPIKKPTKYFRLDVPPPLVTMLGCLWVHGARRVGGSVSGPRHCMQEVLGSGQGRHGTPWLHCSSCHLCLRLCLCLCLCLWLKYNKMWHRRTGFFFLHVLSSGCDGIPQHFKNE